FAFSLISVASSWRLDVQQVMKEGSGQTANRGALLARSVLVSFQVALAASLLIAAGLLLRSFDRLLNQSPGFDPVNVIAAQLELAGAKYRNDDARRAFIDAVLAEISRQPGIDHVALTSVLPFNEYGSQASYDIEGRDAPAGANSPHGNSHVVSEDFFEAMGIPVLQGRSFDATIDGIDA